MERKTKGLLAAGGAIVAAYLVLSGMPKDEGAGGLKERAGKILGAPTTGVEGGATPQNVYQFPTEAFAGFPSPGIGIQALIDAITPGVTPGVTPTKPGEETVEIPPGEEPKKKPTEPWYKYIAGTGLGWTPEAGQAAFERGQRQEAEAAAYLAGHPTLEMSSEGIIVKKKPKTITPSQLTPAQLRIYELMGGIGAPLRPGATRPVRGETSTQKPILGGFGTTQDTISTTKKEAIIGRTPSYVTPGGIKYQVKRGGIKPRFVKSPEGFVHKPYTKKEKAVIVKHAGDKIK